MRKLSNILASLFILSFILGSCRTSNNDEDGNEAFEAGATAEGLKSEKLTLDDVMSFINQNEELSKLSEAIKAAELQGLLSGDSTKYTILAPNDDAFDAISQQNFRQFLKSKNDSELQSLLQAHLIEGNHSMEDLKSGNGTFKALNGVQLEIKVDDGVTINNANIIAADIETPNGTIHIIDAVLK